MNTAAHNDTTNQKGYKLFVGGLIPTCDEGVIREYFDQFGTIVNFELVRDKKTNEARGFAFVYYATKEESEKCFAAVHHLYGRRLDVKQALAKNKAEDRQKEERIHKLFVGGLSQKTNEDALYEYFSKFGNIYKAYLIYDHNTGQSRCFGFVEFNEAESLQKSLAVKKHSLAGRNVECKQVFLKSELEQMESNKKQKKNTKNQKKWSPTDKLNKKKEETKIVNSSDDLSIEEKKVRVPLRARLAEKKEVEEFKPSFDNFECSTASMSQVDQSDYQKILMKNAKTVSALDRACSELSQYEDLSQCQEQSQDFSFPPKPKQSMDYGFPQMNQQQAAPYNPYFDSADYRRSYDCSYHMNYYQQDRFNCNVPKSMQNIEHGQPKSNYFADFDYNNFEGRSRLDSEHLYRAFSESQIHIPESYNYNTAQKVNNTRARYGISEGSQNFYNNQFAREQEQYYPEVGSKNLKMKYSQDTCIDSSLATEVSFNLARGESEDSGFKLFNPFKNSSPEKLNHKLNNLLFEGDNLSRTRSLDKSGSDELSDISVDDLSTCLEKDLALLLD
jgi:RNA recognition motif-containing protein